MDDLIQLTLLTSMCYESYVLCTFLYNCTFFIKKCRRVKWFDLFITTLCKSVGTFSAN